VAASVTEREISLVVAACSSTAAEIATEVSSIVSIVVEMRPMAATVDWVDSWMAAICSEISSVALAVCEARFFTS